MKKILFIESSPRKTESITTDVANKLINKMQHSGDYEIEVLDLWNTDLPHINGTTLSAKYTVFSGNQLNTEQKSRRQGCNRARWHIA